MLHILIQFHPIKINTLLIKLAQQRRLSSQGKKSQTKLLVDAERKIHIGEK